jgi:hypothetical protein
MAVLFCMGSDIWRPLAAAAIALCLPAACTRTGEAGSSPTQRAIASLVPSVQEVRFHAFGSPLPPGERCPTPSRASGGYAVLIGPTDGKPGSRVTIGGITPLFNKAGHYEGPSGKIGLWFNLPFSDWARVYSSEGAPSSNGSVPVLHLGEVTVKGQCSYRAMFRVPTVPAGVYDIVPIEHIRGNASAFPAIEFRVIARAAGSSSP